MNKILYEASYAGSPKIFFENAFIVLWGIFIVGGSARRLKKKQDKMTEEVDFLHKSSIIMENIVIAVLGLALLMETIIIVKRYNEVILGYKRGEYFEVEGIVEDYADHPHAYTFRVNGIKFEVYDSTHIGWGYNYHALKEDVITGDGQHLKIRYIPGSSGIVYIEEIADE